MEVGRKERRRKDERRSTLIVLPSFVTDRQAGISVADLDEARAFELILRIKLIFV